MTRGSFVLVWPVALFLLPPSALGDTVRVAGVDVGSTGSRAVVLEFDPKESGKPVKILMKKDSISAVGEFKGGQMLPARIAETANHLEQFVNTFVTDYKVAKERIHLVGSSSIALATNRNALVAAVEKKTGLTMSFLGSGEEEAQLTAAGLPILSGRSGGGLLIDVGGGNTKGSLKTPTDSLEFSFPFGGRSLTTKAGDVQKAKKVTFREAVAMLRESDLLPAIRKALNGKPALATQPDALLLGGSVYGIVTLVYPEKATDATVEVKLEDFRKFLAILGDKELTLPKVNLASITDPAVRMKAEVDLKDVADKFTPEYLFSGATVVLALGAELQLEGKPLTFVRDAHFAWIVGYLAPKNPPPPPPVPTMDPPSKPVFVDPPPKPLPEPRAMGVPVYRAPTGRYSWDYTGNLQSPWLYPGYTWPAYPPPVPYYAWPGYPR